MYNGHEAYLEDRILASDPLELVRLLYRGAIASVEGARQCLAEGRIAERSTAISKACSLLFELSCSLDRERGGEIAGRLGLLYDYMQRRLLEANTQQSDRPLSEVLGLLENLAEAWAGISKAAEPPAADGAVWAGTTPEPWATTPAGAGWSL